MRRFDRRFKKQLQKKQEEKEREYQNLVKEMRLRDEMGAISSSDEIIERINGGTCSEHYGYVPNLFVNLSDEDLFKRKSDAVFAHVRKNEKDRIFGIRYNIYRKTVKGFEMFLESSYQPEVSKVILCCNKGCWTQL